MLATKTAELKINEYIADRLDIICEALRLEQCVNCGQLYSLDDDENYLTFKGETYCHENCIPCSVLND